MKRPIALRYKQVDCLDLINYSQAPMFQILALSLILSLDSFSGAIALGIKPYRKNQILLFAFLSGLLEGLFLFISSKIGLKIVKLIDTYDHWLAFLLLIGVAIMFIKDGLSQIKNKNSPELSLKGVSFFSILLIAIGTSLDAFAIGLSMGVLEKPIGIFSLFVGLSAFLATLMGVFLAKQVPKFLIPYFSFISALILIVIAIKNLH